MWTSDRNGHFFFSLSFISLLSSFFWDHRLSRPTIPVASARSRFSAFNSSPSLVFKARRRQLTRSRHSLHSGGTSRKPSRPTGKTLCKTPKHALFSIFKPPVPHHWVQALKAIFPFSTVFRGLPASGGLSSEWARGIGAVPWNSG